MAAVIAAPAGALMLVGLRVHDRIDAAAYQRRMSALAGGQRRTPTGPTNAVGGRHG